MLLGGPGGAIRTSQWGDSLHPLGQIAPRPDPLPILQSQPVAREQSPNGWRHSPESPA